MSQKNRQRFLIIILLIFTHIILFVGGFFIGKQFEECKEFYLASSSPRGDWDLIIEYTPPWLFGHHRMHVFARNKTFRKRLIHKFLIANDGKNLNATNCTITWKLEKGREIAYINANGEEQKPASLRLDVMDLY